MIALAHGFVFHIPIPRQVFALGTLDLIIFHYHAGSAFICPSNRAPIYSPGHFPPYFTQSILRESNIVSLYADDLLLYVSNPATAILFVISILNEFGSFSGYKLNLQKSECFPLNILSSDLQQLNLPISVSHSLNIKIFRGQYHSAFSNFTPLLNQAKSNFQRWGNLPLMLTGRINAVKMTILFITYSNPFQDFLQKSFFHSLNKLITPQNR